MFRAITRSKGYPITPLGNVKVTEGTPYVLRLIVALNFIFQLFLPELTAENLMRIAERDEQEKHGHNVGEGHQSTSTLRGSRNAQSPIFVPQSVIIPQRPSAHSRGGMLL